MNIEAILTPLLGAITNSDLLDVLVVVAIIALIVWIVRWVR